jgi:hypothetical protein
MRTEVTRRVLRIGGTFLLIVVILASAALANLAISYQLSESPAVRIGACMVFNVVALGAVTGFVLRSYSRAALVYAAVYAVLLVWWASINPSNDKDCATSAWTTKQTLRSVGSSGHSFQNCDRSM